MPSTAHTIGSLLAQTAARFPEKEALVFQEERISWRQLDRWVTNLAAAFLEMGVQPGDRVGILCTTRPEYIVAYMAAVRIGAIATGFNMQYTPREVADLARLTQPTVMVILDQKGSFQRHRPALEELPFLRHVLVIGPEAQPGTRSLHALMEQERPELTPVLAQRADAVTPDQGALIVFTGGTTGVPKAALLTHRNIVSNIRAQVRHLGFGSEDRIVLHLPMNHVSGATLMTIAAVMTGATLVVLERFHPARTLELVARERVTVLGQVPTMFIMEFQLPDLGAYDLSSLRTVIVAGAPTPPPVMERIAGLAPVAIHGYGLTEVGGMVTYTRPGEGVDTLLAGAGPVADEFQLRVVDSEHRPLPPGQVGEIAVRGACVMAGYWGNPEETALVRDAEGWLYTGDLGRLSPDGAVTIVGRRKEMILTGGFNVYPWEIEQYVLTHPDVALAACIGVPDPVMGEVGHLFLVPKPGATLDPRGIRRFCKAGLARYKVPRHVTVREALPLTPVGKVDKRRLREEQRVATLELW